MLSIFWVVEHRNSVEPLQPEHRISATSSIREENHCKKSSVLKRMNLSFLLCDKAAL